MSEFKSWLETVEDLGTFAKRSRRVKSADAYPKEPTNAGVIYAKRPSGAEMVDTGRQPLDSIDTDKAKKIIVGINMFVPAREATRDDTRVRFTFVGESDQKVMYWVEKIRSGERPPILVSSLFGGSQRGVIGLSVMDGNHRATAYYILRVAKVPVVLTAGAKKYLSGQ